MDSVKLNFKLVKKVKDNRFDENMLHQYVLSVQLGVRDFQIAIINSVDQRLLLLEDYVLGELSGVDEWLELIKDLFDDHPLLNAGFWKSVKVSFKNKKFVHVPAPLFDESQALNYLKFNASISDQDKVLHYTDVPSKVTTVFCMPLNVYNWFLDRYNNTQVYFYHQSIALIRGVLSMEQEEAPSLCVFVDRFKLHVISVKGERLIYYNQFVIKQFSDYVKYIMLVLNGLSMNQETCRIFLWGYIGRNTPHYKEFCRYVRNVKFGARPHHFKFGYLFDEVQDHHFLDLYAISLLQEVSTAQ